MKTFFSLFFFAILGFGMAQPQKFNYQALALGSNGKPLKNAAVSLRLSILDSAANGTVLYTETQPATTDAGGQFSVYLGTGTPTAGTFASIPWANGYDKFLKVELDAQGGTNYQTMGTTQLVSVPYAMAVSQLKEGTKIHGKNGLSFQLNVGSNGPVWTCYPPVIQANAGIDQFNICSNGIVLNGNSQNGATLNWAILTSTATDGSGMIMTVGNSFEFFSSPNNSYTLLYSLTNACGSSYDTLNLSFAPATTSSSAGPDQLSLLGTTATLAANAPAAGETGTWTIISGNGASLSNANSSAATFTKGTDSSYTLVWTITGPCGTSRDTVNLLFPAPVVTACGQTVTYAGESYPTVQIGTQCWLAKNLNVGTMIQGANDQTNNSTLEKYCYNNDPANCTTYGGLYQWAEAVQYQNGASNSTSPSPAFSGNVQGICPTGWHLPSDAEYCTLTRSLDPAVDCSAITWSGTDVGGQMKSTNALWFFPNMGATNSSGFSALPGGVRNEVGFGNVGGCAIFWSTSDSSNTSAFQRYLHKSNSFISRYSDPKFLGFSVRCTQD